MRPVIFSIFVVLLAGQPGWAADSATQIAARQTLDRAVDFFHQKVAVHGGYVWDYGGDLQLRQGEGRTDEHTIWVQPPGTPTIGEAFLDAFDATGNPKALSAAMDAGRALLAGQLESGGWTYHVRFDPKEAAKYRYRQRLGVKPIPPAVKTDAFSKEGWSLWKQRKIKGNQTTLDDDTTQAAVRFLMRLDKTVEFTDKRVHEAVTFALASLLRSQYPNGGWSHNYDRFPSQSPDEHFYPVKQAGFPATWSKTWPKTFAGCYITNDNQMSSMIDTMLLAHEIYKDDRYLNSAKHAGDFLLLAQMPDPQPAWAQQYNANMEPEWSRAFEPPSVTGGESQSIMRGLIELALRTNDAKYLKPIPSAIAYLRKSALKDGRLARFYELKTNRPLYFTRDKDRRHQLTYSDKNLPDHYGWIIDNKLDGIEKQYQNAANAIEKGRTASALAAKKGAPSDKAVLAVIKAMDARGAWVEKGVLKHHKLEPESGVISCKTFAKNVALLSRYVKGDN